MCRLPTLSISSRQYLCHILYIFCDLDGFSHWLNFALQHEVYRPQWPLTEVSRLLGWRVGHGGIRDECAHGNAEIRWLERWFRFLRLSDARRLHSRLLCCKSRILCDMGLWICGTRTSALGLKPRYGSKPWGNLSTINWLGIVERMYLPPARFARCLIKEKHL